MKNSFRTRTVLCLLLALSAMSARALSWRSNGARALSVVLLAQATPIQSAGAPNQMEPAASAGTTIQRSTPALANSPIQPSAAQPATSPAQEKSTTIVNPPLQLGTTSSDPNELRVTGLGGGSTQWTIVILLTFLTLIPSLLICMTPFARLLIVFHFLRQALGLQTTPSNQTLIGLSAIMTFSLMQPIGITIYKDSVVPLQAGKITALDAVTRAATPMRQFMSHYVREKDVALFLEISKEPRPADINDVSFRVLLPAYILSELKAGFQIGAVLFLPFLVVDMVVASITTSVGMMQLPPVVISTPLKLLLFLMVDGWHLLIGALMRSFN
jgi:flagellar biosynthetic protein FliP